MRESKTRESVGPNSAQLLKGGGWPGVSKHHGGPRLIRNLWPRTLFVRITLILCIGLTLAFALSYAIIIHERAGATTDLMLGYMEQDVASSVALLDRLQIGFYVLG